MADIARTMPYDITTAPMTQEEQYKAFVEGWRTVQPVGMRYPGSDPYHDPLFLSLAEQYPLGYQQWMNEAYAKKDKSWIDDVFNIGMDVTPVLIAAAGTYGLVTGGGLTFTGGGGVAAESPAILETPSALAPSTSTMYPATTEELAAYDAAIAEGAKEGVGLVPMTAEPVIATGAETAVSSGGLLASVGSGIAGIFKSLGGTLLTTAAQGANSIIDREVQSLFGGSSGTGTPGGTVNIGGESGTGIQMLPWILIGITLIGAFILTRKGKGKYNGK